MIEAWQRALQSESSRKIILLTMLPSGQFGATDKHPARQNDALRFSTHVNAVVPIRKKQSVLYSDLPFWPFLANWPDITHEILPQNHEAPSVDTVVELMSNSLSTAMINQINGTPSLDFRIDLWSDGIDLEDVVPLMAGTATAGNVQQESARLIIRLSDMAKKRDVMFPAGPIDRSEFPNAPDDVLDVRGRQIIIGGFPFGVACPQIDQVGKKFYLCEPPAYIDPTYFYVGGEAVGGEDQPWVTVELMETSRQPYSVVNFKEPIRDLGYIGEVIAAGGIGVPSTDLPAMYFLLHTIGQYPLTPQAQTLSQSTPFLFSVLLNKKGSVLEIVRNRLISQTNLVLLERFGKIDLIPLTGQNIEHRFSVPSQLKFSLDERKTNETAIDTVFNDIEVFYGRDVSSLTAIDYKPRRSVRVNEWSGGTIGTLLAKSQSRYGRRVLQMEALDLIDQHQAYEFAKFLAKQHAIIHQIRRYQATWFDGMRADVGHTVYLTDPDWSYVNKKMIVTGKTFGIAGPILRLQSVDDSTS